MALTSSYSGTEMTGASPRSSTAVVVATTEASTTTLKLRALKRCRITSRAKKTPAIGALKIAAMPAAAPAASSSFTFSSESPSDWATFEPIAAPMWMIGPSLPAEPPEPIVSAEAIGLKMAMCGRTRPPAVSTASITSATPGPRTSRT